MTKNSQEKLEKELEELKEALKIEHYSTCSDDSCGDSCEPAFKHHFNCWLNERTEKIKKELEEARNYLRLAQTS